MQKIMFYLFLLNAIQSVNALDFSLHLDSINEKQNGTSTSNTNCCGEAEGVNNSSTSYSNYSYSDYNWYFDSNLFIECINAICGTAEQNESYQELFDQVTNNTSKDTQFSQKLAKDAMAYYDKKIEYDLSRLRDLKKLIEENDLMVPENLAQWHKLRFILSNIGLLGEVGEKVYDMDQVEIDLVGFKMKIPYNLSKVREEISKYVKAEMVNSTVDALTEFTYSDEFQTARFAENFGWSTVVLSKHPGKNLREIIKIESQLALDRFDTIIKDGGVALDEIGGLTATIDKGVLTDIISNKDPSEAILDEFFLSAELIHLIHRLMVEKKGINSLNKMDLNNYDKVYDREDLIRKLDDNIAGIENLKLNKEKIDQDIKYCQAILDNNLMALPDKIQKQNLIQNSYLLKDRLKKQLISKFSQKTREGLVPFYDGIHLVIPDTKDDLGLLMNSTIIKEINDFSDKYSRYRTMKGEKKEKQMVLFSISDVNEMAIDGYTNDLRDICKDYQLKNLNDKAYNFGIGAVEISWQSVRNPLMGEGILAHELGHVISNYFEKDASTSKESFEKYKNTRICLNNMQSMAKSNTKEKRQFISEDGKILKEEYLVSQYTEEDWADLVSATVTSSGKTNVGCFLYKQIDNQYSGLEIFKTEDVKKKHSPHLFRTLHIEFVKKGKLPDVCNKAIKTNNITLNLKRCEF